MLWTETVCSVISTDVVVTNSKSAMYACMVAVAYANSTRGSVFVFEGYRPEAVNSCAKYTTGSQFNCAYATGHSQNGYVSVSAGIANTLPWFIVSIVCLIITSFVFVRTTDFYRKKCGYPEYEESDTTDPTDATTNTL